MAAYYFLASPFLPTNVHDKILIAKAAGAKKLLDLRHIYYLK